MTKTTKPPSGRASEQEFLANYDASLYPHPSLSVDVALITALRGKLRGTARST